MVFTEIQEYEKEAFFSLLDEYFTHRPHLLPQPEAAADATLGSQAAGFLGRQMAQNPQATANLVSSALRANTPSGDPAAQAAANPRLAGQLGRAVAGGMSTLSSLSKPPPPQPPVKPAGVRTATPSGLVTRKALGTYSTESKGAFFASGVQNVLSYKKPQPAQVDAPLAPQEHHAIGSGLPPPPVRRGVAAAPAPAPEPEYEQEQEDQFVEAQEQPGGEWVEALYDYQGDAATDISLAAGEQFVLVERTSADWWTGEVNGKRGLFPASYVKVL